MMCRRTIFLTTNVSKANSYTLGDPFAILTLCPGWPFSNLPMIGYNSLICVLHLQILHHLSLGDYFQKPFQSLDFECIDCIHIRDPCLNVWTSFRIQGFHNNFGKFFHAYNDISNFNTFETCSPYYQFIPIACSKSLIQGPWIYDFDRTCSLNLTMYPVGFFF